MQVISPSYILHSNLFSLGNNSKPNDDNAHWSCISMHTGLMRVKDFTAEHAWVSWLGIMSLVTIRYIGLKESFDPQQLNATSFLDH